jgi:outer membrane receptor protein involved in Fe transport
VCSSDLIELFAAQGANLFDMDDDPCDLTDPAGDGTATAAACVGTNPWQVTTAQANGGALSSPAGQYNFLGGGNTTLAPEEGDTITYGFVWQPDFVPSLTISVDYFDIEIKKLVSTTGAQNTINACYFFADATSCARINRNANGALWVGSGQVEDLNTNIGGIATSGYDINASYTYDLGEMGGLSFNLVGTLLSDLTTDPGLATATSYDCTGFYANQCGTPNPEWRHHFRAGWETPWLNLSLAATWRHFGEVSLISAATNQAQTGRVDSVLEAQNYFDVSGNMPLGDNVKLRFGINNIFDDDPPLSASVGTTGNGNTYPQSYDALGRFMFLGATVDF